MEKSISDWVDKFKRIPVELMEEDCFRVGSQIAKKLVGVNDDKVQPNEEIVATLTQAKEDEDELSPQWIAEMEVMIQVYDKKKSINGDFERPSFILFSDGVFDTQPGDRPESSTRDEPAGEGERQMNAGGQDATQQTLVMTGVDSSDGEDHSIEHHSTNTMIHFITVIVH